MCSVDEFFHIAASIETGCAHEFSAWPDPQMLGYRLGAPFRHLSNLWEQHRDEIRANRQKALRDVEDGV